MSLANRFKNRGQLFIFSPLFHPLSTFCHFRKHRWKNFEINLQFPSPTGVHREGEGSRLCLARTKIWMGPNLRLFTKQNNRIWDFLWNWIQDIRWDQNFYAILCQRRQYYIRMKRLKSSHLSSRLLLSVLHFMIQIYFSSCSRSERHKQRKLPVNPILWT